MKTPIPFLLLLAVLLSAGCTEKSPDRELASGISSLTRGELLNARAHFEAALSLAIAQTESNDLGTPWTRMSETLNWLGLANKGMGLTNDAIRAWEEAIQLDPQAFAPTYNLGATLLDSGDTSGGIRSLTRAAELDKKDVRAALRIAEHTTRIGRWDLAKRMYFEAHKRSPKTTEALVGLGRLALLTDRPGEAENYFMQALEIQPDSPTALYNLGVLFSMNPNQREQGRAYLARYRELFPYAPRSEAAMRRLTGEIIEQTSFKNTTTAQPRPAAREWLLVQTALQNGEKETAYEHALRAIELASDGDARQEEEMIRRALDAFPERAPILLAAGQFHAKQERLTEARDILLRAQSLQPDNTMILFELARVSSGLGEYDVTVLVLKQLVEQEPGNPDALWELAETYGEKLGMAQRGISAYLDFANRFPTDLRTSETGERIRRLKDLAPPPEEEDIS